MQLVTSSSFAIVAMALLLAAIMSSRNLAIKKMSISMLTMPAIVAATVTPPPTPAVATVWRGVGASLKCLLCHFDFYLCFYRWLTVAVVVVVIRAPKAF